MSCSCSWALTFLNSAARAFLRGRDAFALICPLKSLSGIASIRRCLLRSYIAWKNWDVSHSDAQSAMGGPRRGRCSDTTATRGAGIPKARFTCAASARLTNLGAFSRERKIAYLPRLAPTAEIGPDSSWQSLAACIYPAVDSPQSASLQVCTVLGNIVFVVNAKSEGEGEDSEATGLR